MQTFESDGVRLAYHLTGAGTPVVCLPGGPMQASSYLGDLGGLTGRRPFAMLDLRGTGGSEPPADVAGYRCDRQVPDVEALRRHLGVERLDLAAHSAGAAVALLYAARFPEQVARLVLVTPSPRVVDLQVSDGDRRAIAELRRGEPWFGDAFAGFERIWAGRASDADWAAITPFMHGRWDDDTRRAEEQLAAGSNPEAAAAYYGDGRPDPADVRRRLRNLAAPVLVVGGGYDVSLPPARAQAYAELFPAGRAVVLPRAGHFPWLDDPAALADAVTGFLDGP